MRIAAGRRDVQHVGGGRHFRLRLIEQFARGESEVQLFTHALRHFARMSDQDFRIGFALRFAARALRYLQRGADSVPL